MVFPKKTKHLDNIPLQELYNSGMTIREIAKKFNVSYQAISNRLDKTQMRINPVIQGKYIGITKGMKHSEETKKLMSEIKKKNLPIYAFKKGNHPRTEFKKGDPRLMGENNPSWRGGKARDRKGHQWQLIRKEILIKYEYKCLHCGITENIHVHHKIPYRIKQEHKIENLIPLCNSCHGKEEHKIQKVIYNS